MALAIRSSLGRSKFSLVKSTISLLTASVVMAPATASSSYHTSNLTRNITPTSTSWGASLNHLYHLQALRYSIRLEYLVWVEMPRQGLAQQRPLGTLFSGSSVGTLVVEVKGNQFQLEYPKVTFSLPWTTWTRNKASNTQPLIQNGIWGPWCSPNWIGKICNLSGVNILLVPWATIKSRLEKSVIHILMYLLASL
jgi:hypothetical protein